ncbi:MAG TPA: hypothetical protein VGG01_13455 [Xanthobacteraceae bacterium]
MRFRPLTSIVFVLLALLAVPINPAMAASHCSCDDDALLPSGVCRQYHCVPVEAATPGFRQIRSSSECRRSRVLLCDGDTCKLGCETKAAKKK